MTDPTTAADAARRLNEYIAAQPSSPAKTQALIDLNAILLREKAAIERQAAETALRMGVNPELPGVNMYVTTCIHGADLRFTPRCYLCKPWPDDSPVYTINPSGGHRHEGEWCAKCVEHGAALASEDRP